MNIRRAYFLCFLILSLQACSVSGPVHFYPGEPLGKSETALLQVPGPISLTKIDGKDVDVPSQEDGFYQVYLLPGLHRIEFKYELYWGDPVSGMIVRSEKVGIETPFRAGMKYKLLYPEPNDEAEAYTMANKFEANLLELETGRKVVSRTLEDLNMRGVETALVSTKRDTPQAKESSTPAPVSTDITPPQGIDADTAAREDVVRRLKFWWLMADEQERKQFKQWMQSIEDKNSPNQP